MVEVISSGLYTSIQDLGRFGYRRFGIPVSGAMDSYSAKLANRLLGNSETDAVMEITFTGPVLKFHSSTQIAVTGAGFSPTINDSEIPLNSRVEINTGSILKFGLPSYGMRSYLSVLGGFQTENVLDSFSFYNGITNEGKLRKGDVLLISNSEKPQLTASVKIKIDKTNFSNSEIEVWKGPDFEKLSIEIQQKILSTKLIVMPESNRMAYLLTGWEILSTAEIITAPVRPGTVQLTPSGQCIVLMRDAQTTGGYARILQLDENSLNRLGQKRSGENVVFKLQDA